MIKIISQERQYARHLLNQYVCYKSYLYICTSLISFIIQKAISLLHLKVPSHRTSEHFAQIKIIVSMKVAEFRQFLLLCYF